LTRPGPRLAGDRRRLLAQSYLLDAAHYDSVRPGYPAEAIEWILPVGCAVAADLGAGTGILTGELLARGLQVTAVDPSADMLALLQRNHPAATVRQGSAEHTGLPGSSVELVTAAQAWHWFDPAAAGAEAARILVPGGTLALLWNQLDVSVPWIHRLSRIMHAGDVYRPDFRPDVGGCFGPLTAHSTRWAQRLSTDGIIDLARSRSYYRAATEAVRRKVVENLRWYLHDYLDFTPGTVVDIPYFTHSWKTRRLG
jgi:SAM-dependent methyltransferase